jgi:hypothetical protein
MDSNEKKIKCQKCGTETAIDEASYCIECGELLSNYCSNEQCILNNYDDDGKIALPQIAKYCYECGCKSTYFDILNKKDPIETK